MQYISSYLYGQESTQSNDANKDKQKKLEEEVKSQLNGWNVLGASGAMDRIAATVHVLFLNPANRIDLIKDIVTGAKSAILSPSSDESKESFVEKFMQGAIKASGHAIGKVTGYAIKQLLNNAHGHHLNPEDQDLFAEAINDLEAAEKVPEKIPEKTLTEARETLTKLVKQYSTEIEGLILARKSKQISPNPSKEEVPEESKGPQKIEKKESPKKPIEEIANEVRQNPDNISKLDREQLCELALFLSSSSKITPENQKELKNVLRSLSTFLETTQRIHEHLCQYQIIIGKVNVTSLFSAVKHLLGAKDANDVNQDPEAQLIEIRGLLSEAQGAISKLKGEHSLYPPVQSRAVANAEGADQNPVVPSEAAQATNEKLKKLAHDATMIATMMAVDRTVGTVRALSVYQGFLHQKEPAEAFFNSLSRMKKMMARALFGSFMSLIESQISKAFDKIAEETRSRLNNHKELPDFIGKKLSNIGSYFSTINGLAADFVEKQRGLFSEFCENNMPKYGDKLSLPEMKTAYQKYLVENYTFRPDCSIQGFRVPLLTSLTERVILSIRKAVFNNLMTKYKVIDEFLVSGVTSFQAGQLASKMILRDQLKKLQQFRDSGESAKKTDELRNKLISPDTKKAIKVFSGHLLRFVKIEQCEEDPAKLKATKEDAILTTAQKIKEYLKLFTNVDFTSPDEIMLKLKEIMPDMCSTMTENMLISLATMSPDDVEGLITSVIDKMSDALTTESSPEKNSSIIQEINALDTEIMGLVQDLSSTGIRTAFGKTLDTLTHSKHERIETLVKEEAEHARAWKEKTKALCQAVTNAMAREQNRFEKTKESIATLLDEVNSQLSHISSMLVSEKFAECYPSVKSDLQEMYRVVIQDIGAIIPEIAKLAEENKRISTVEIENNHIATLNNAVVAIKEDSTAELIKGQVEIIRPLQDKVSLETDINPLVESLEKTPPLIIQLQSDVNLFNQRNEKTTKIKELQNVRVNEIPNLNSTLNDLLSLLKGYKRIRKNKEYTTDEAVTKAQDTAKQSIVEKIATIKEDYATQDSLFKNSLNFLDRVTQVSDLTPEVIFSLKTKLSKGILSTPSYSIFSQLYQLQKAKLREIAVLEKEIAALNWAIGEKKEGQTREQLQEKQQAFNVAKQAIISTCSTKTERNNTQNLASEQTMNTSLSTIDLPRRTLEATTKPKVPGYISLGEKPIKDVMLVNIAPLLVEHAKATIAPALNSFSIKQHWQQYVIRTVMLPNVIPA